MLDFYNDLSKAGKAVVRNYIVFFFTSVLVLISLLTLNSGWFSIGLLITSTMTIIVAIFVLLKSLKRMKYSTWFDED